jgi:hypothetical protein
MPRISTDNYDTVASWNGSQDLFVVEQPDGTKVATPAMVKQFIEAGDFEVTGKVIDGHGNVLADMAKSDDVDAEFSQLDDDLTLEKFTPTLASALGRPNVFEHNCFYNPKTKQVHIQVLIYSSDALIPTTNATVFTIANKYRPANDISLGMAMLISSANWNTRLTNMEKCFIGSNGAFWLINFVYGSQATKVLYIEGDYIAA